MLENKGRGPVTIELPGQAHLRPQEVTILGRDPKSCAVGLRVEERLFPTSITLAKGEKSAPLAIAKADAIALLRPGLRLVEVDVPETSTPAPPASPEEPASPVKE